MLADELDYVIGVDTHRDLHALAVIEAPRGSVLIEAQVEVSSRGYTGALALANEQAPGRRAFAIEGTGSYGAGLARFLEAAGEHVLEVGRAPREDRRSRAKSDALDAIRAARSVLGRERLARPRAGGRREQLRALVVCREGALQAKRAGLCQLRDLLLCCPPVLREELAALSRTRLLRRCGGLRPERRSQEETRGTLFALRSLAQRVAALTREERELGKEIQALVAQIAPELLCEPGVGAISAARLLLSWSHPGRIHSEAAFARLAGAAPTPASSGKLVRYRLDPGGDRQLNRALHTIVLSRRKIHPPTIAYIERRTREGKSVRDAIRSLKRYLARHLYRCSKRPPQGLDSHRSIPCVSEGTSQMVPTTSMSVACAGSDLAAQHAPWRESRPELHGLTAFCARAPRNRTYSRRFRLDALQGLSPYVGLTPYVRVRPPRP